MLPDIELIAALRRKDDDASSQLFDQFGSDIFSLIYKITGDDSIAKELTIKTFESFESNKFNYNPKARSIFSTLLKTARDLAHKKSATEEITYNSLPIQDTPLINNNFSEIINTIYLNGQSLQRAAKTMRVPISSVRTRFRLAINALSKKYNSESSQFLLALLIVNHLIIL